MNPEEHLEIVDYKGEVIGSAPRSELILKYISGKVLVIYEK